MFINTYISHQQILVTCYFSPSLPYMVSLCDLKLANLRLGETICFPSRQSDRQVGIPFFGPGSACMACLAPSMPSNTAEGTGAQDEQYRSVYGHQRPLDKSMISPTKASTRFKAWTPSLHWLRRDKKTLNFGWYGAIACLGSPCGGGPSRI